MTRVNEQRAELRALRTKKGQQFLTPLGRRERTKAILDASAAARDKAREAHALARAALVGRQQFSVDAILRGATFVELVPIDNSLGEYSLVNEHRTLINELRLGRDEQTRTRWREELRDETPEALAAMAIEAAESFQLAKLQLIRCDYRRRRRENPNAPNGSPLDTLGSAIGKAEELVDKRRPRATQEVLALFDRIENHAVHLEFAANELDTGIENENAEGAEAVRDRRKELGKDPDEQLEAAEVLELVNQRAEQARNLEAAAADRIDEAIIEAIREDEDTAAAITADDTPAA